jgi:hypothetical protein
MKQKFALLTIVGALLALAVPAASSASMYPASANFEVGASGAAPTLGTSIGSCQLKVAGTVPKAPANEATSLLFALTPATSTCSSGASIKFNGEWKLLATNFSFQMAASGGPSNAVEFRSTTLPNCKLAGNYVLGGLFHNGISSPKSMKSAMQPTSSSSLTWADDGGTCAIAGTKETLSYGFGYAVWTVNNLTTPATPIIVAN